MGNYLLALRVPAPTPDEDERNHPCYYDWSIPKRTPFRAADEQKTNFDLESKKDRHQHNTSTSQQEQLRNTLTSTVDTSSKKPFNLKSKSTSSSNSLEKNLDKSSRAGSKPSSSSSGSSSIKKVDSTRAHTIDQRKYGDIEDQAAIKAATNIHNITSQKRSS